MRVPRRAAGAVIAVGGMRLHKRASEILCRRPATTTPVSSDAAGVVTEAWFQEHFCRGGQAHERTIRTDLPGVVVEIAADRGELVSPGQAIVVLESMKMEIPLVAEHDGRLVDLTVSVGDAVGAGDGIAVLRCCEAGRRPPPPAGPPPGVRSPAPPS